MQIHIRSTSAANIVSRGENSEFIQFLPQNLIPIKEITAKACAMCKGTELALEKWLAMAYELLEAAIGTHSLSRSQRAEVQRALDDVRSEMHTASVDRRLLREDLPDLERYYSEIVLSDVQSELLYENFTGWDSKSCRYTCTSQHWHCTVPVLASYESSSC